MANKIKLYIFLIYLMNMRINSEYSIMSLEEIEISIGLIKINSSFLSKKISPYVNNLEFPGGKKKNKKPLTIAL